MRTAIQLLVCLTVICAGCDVVQSQNSSLWRTKTRLQVGYEFDNNVRENPTDSLANVEDSSARILFHSRLSRRDRHTNLRLEYQGGLQTYLNNSLDNKLINDLSAFFLMKAGAFQFGLRSNGRLKVYLSDDLDYASGKAAVFFQPPRVFGFGAEVAAGVAGLEYENFTIFDYATVRYEWSVFRNLAPQLRWRASVAREVLDYERASLRFDAPANNLLIGDDLQEDRAWQIRTEVDFTREFLLNVAYSFKHNNSNSFGYDYTRHQFTLLFAVSMFDRVWLRSLAAVQLKRYAQKSLPIFPIDADPEREQSNFIIIDVSRDLNDVLSAILRFSYYSNESIVRNRFYDKTLLTLGFDFRF